MKDLTPVSLTPVSLQRISQAPTGNAIRCRDRVSRWSGPGNAEFRRALDKAKGKDQVIRLVMAHSHDPAAVDSGQDASKIKKSFEPREDWLGKLILWDGENYEIEFRRR